MSGTVPLTLASTDTDFNVATKTNVGVTGTGTAGSAVLLKPTGSPCAAGTDCASGLCSSSMCISCNATITFLAKTYKEVVGADGRCWLDRNLGATQVATSATDAASYGDLYQWGRPADGHQIPTSTTTATLATTITPGHANFINNYSASPYDWVSSNENTRWQGTTSVVNNVCPTGFRPPTNAEWNTLIAAAPAITNSAAAFSSTLKLPMAGNRLTDGTLNYQGSLGYYWSSSINSTNAYYFYFISSAANTYYANRADGFSVRCVKN